MTKVMKSAALSFSSSFSPFGIRHSSFSDSLESLRVPVRLGDAAFAFVFEKFVHRREHDPGAPGFDPDIEVEFILQKMNVAVTDHAKELAGNFEIVGVNDPILDGEIGLGLPREAVAGAGNNGGDQLGERAEDRDREDIAVGHFGGASA